MRQGRKMTRETGRQKRSRSPSTNPRKYRLMPCHQSDCVQVDSAILLCWCDTDELELKKAHNEWIDILESPNANLDIIEEFSKRVQAKFGVSLYKKPDTWCDRVDWSQFDFAKLGHLIAQMGKFSLLLYFLLITVQVTHSLFQKDKELALDQAIKVE